MGGIPISRKVLQDLIGNDPATISKFESVFKSVYLTLVGDVTGEGMGTIQVTISPGSVTLGKMAALPPVTIIGNDEAGDATPLALGPARVTAMLNPFTSDLKGLVPSSGGGTSNYLRADGAWDVPPAAGPASGDLAGAYPNPTVAGLKGSSIPSLAPGNLAWSGMAWIFDGTAYAPLSGGTFTGLCTFNAGVVVGAATAAQAKIGTTSGAGLVMWGKTGSAYDFALLNPGNSAYWMRVVTGATYPEFPQGLNSLSVLRMSGTQVLTTQQTGLGATLGAATLTGTYATDLAVIQALYNKVVALETKLKTHGLVAT